MSTVVLRSEDALKSRFHANAFGYHPPPPQQPPMNPRRRKPPAPAHPAGAAAPAPAPAPAPVPHKPNLTGPAPSSRSPPPKPTPARTGRKHKPAAGAGKDNDGGAADELCHHRRRLVMEEVTILKRGEAMKPSVPVPPGSNGRDDPPISPTVPIDLNPKKLGFPAVNPVYAGPGFSISSPAPSSVPYPALLLRPLAASEEATRSLLRLLRLNQFAP